MQQAIVAFNSEVKITGGCEYFFYESEIGVKFHEFNIHINKLLKHLEERDNLILKLRKQREKQNNLNK